MVKRLPRAVQAREAAQARREGRMREEAAGEAAARPTGGVNPAGERQNCHGRAGVAGARASNAAGACGCGEVVERRQQAGTRACSE